MLVFPSLKLPVASTSYQLLLLDFLISPNCKHYRNLLDQASAFCESQKHCYAALLSLGIPKVLSFILTSSSQFCQLQLCQLLFFPIDFPWRAAILTCRLA